MNHVPGFGDETNYAPLEGREDRRRPLVVECDPADRGSVLAKRPELDGLDLESLCLLLAERDGVRIGARTLVPLCRCRRLRPCDAIGPEPGKRGRLPLTARPSTRQITIPTLQIMPMRLGLFVMCSGLRLQSGRSRGPHKSIPSAAPAFSHTSAPTVFSDPALVIPLAGSPYDKRRGSEERENDSRHEPQGDHQARSRLLGGSYPPSFQYITVW